MVNVNSCTFSSYINNTCPITFRIGCNVFKGGIGNRKIHCISSILNEEDALQDVMEIAVIDRNRSQYIRRVAVQHRLVNVEIIQLTTIQNDAIVRSISCVHQMLIPSSEIIQMRYIDFHVFKFSSRAIRNGDWHFRLNNNLSTICGLYDNMLAVKSNVVFIRFYIRTGSHDDFVTACSIVQRQAKSIRCTGVNVNRCCACCECYQHCSNKSKDFFHNHCVFD